MSNTMLADGIVLAAPFKAQQFSCLIAKFKFNHVKLNMPAATDGVLFADMA